MTRALARAASRAGVRDALSAVLASPHFLYRAESGEGEGIVALSDLELASRLSFFFWGSVPDEELLELAEDGRLSKPDVLAKQVKRMLADDRAEGARRGFRVPVARAREARHDRSGPRAVSAGERSARSARSAERGARALHRQRAAQRSQRHGAPDRGLHVLERTPRDALRHRDRQRRALPRSEAGGRVALRAARQRRDPDVDVVSEPHVARAARRLGLGAPARFSAACAAADVPTSRTTNAASRRERCARGSSSTARIRRASRATA